jgi:ubiquinone/menaquinone biosynthesis C-methylase UbiE
MSGASDYVLGHTARELDRLDLQGVLYRGVTRRAVVEAGVGAGWRVLDLGCGSGDVTRLVADLVGPNGAVVGVDRDEDAVRAAQARTTSAHVRFLAAEARGSVPGAPFDALVGRFFLMHQRDPAAVLADAARAVRGGGVVVMVESSMDTLREGIHSRPRSELYDRVVRWKCDVVGGAGADLHAGMRLRETFERAGLPAPVTRLEARVDGAADSPVWTYMAESVKSMLPRARALGISTGPVDPVDTLARRLRDEVVGMAGVVLLWPVVCAWTRVP